MVEHDCFSFLNKVPVSCPKCLQRERFLRVQTVIRVPLQLLAHLSRRLKGELIVYPCSGVRRRRRRRRCPPFSNMNISEASWPIAIKFYLKHHWGRGKAAWGFGADQFRTLVSMATDSSHRVIMGKTASSSFLEYF